MEQKAVSIPIGAGMKTSLLSKIKAPYLRIFFANPKIVWAMVILVPMILLTFLAPWLPLHAPLESNVRSSLAAPSFEHIFGTDKLGRDVFSRTLSGTKVSLMIGISVALISLIFGIIFGTISGFYGKFVGRLIMGIVDILLAFPSLLLAIGMVAILGAGAIPVICAITLADVPRFIRLQRSLVISLKSRAFIDAARTVKASQTWLMTKHIIPNTIAPLLVAASIAAANAILIEASLSFLGLGIMLPEPSLGNIIKDGQLFLQQAWWISTFPGLVILFITISFHFLSDGIREILDPRSRN